MWEYVSQSLKKEKEKKKGMENMNWNGTWFSSNKEKYYPLKEKENNLSKKKKKNGVAV